MPPPLRESKGATFKLVTPPPGGKPLCSLTKNIGLAQTEGYPPNGRNFHYGRLEGNLESSRNKCP